jgi:hypothetical protein
MKVLILSHGEGEYDEYMEYNDFAFLIPDNLMFKDLWDKFCKDTDTEDEGGFTNEKAFAVWLKMSGYEELKLEEGRF